MPPTYLGTHLGTDLAESLGGATLKSQFDLVVSNKGYAIFDADMASATVFTDYVNPSRNITVASGTLATPVASAVFGGRKTVVTTGTQWADSNQPPAFWKLLHDGTGAEEFHLCRPTLLASRILAATRNVSASTEIGHAFYPGGSGVFNSLFANGVGEIGSCSGGAYVANQAVFFSGLTGGGTATLFQNGTQVATAALTGPSASNPNATLRLFAGAVTGALPFSGEWRASYYFLPLTPTERAWVNAYCASQLV